MSEVTPPRTVADLLAEARSELTRVLPASAATRMREGNAILIDIRGDHQRERDGLIPGAHLVPRNVLEWRLDPACPDRDRELTSARLPVILLCDEGYQSSLAAVVLRSFGVDATDVEGGFQAWRAAELPVIEHDRHV